MSSIAVVPILIFIGLLIIASAFVLCMYFLVYKRHVNSALQQESRPTPMPEPRSIGRVILIIIASVCMIVLLIRTSELKNEISDLQSQYNSQLFGIRNQIDQIYDDFNVRIKKENSLFSSFDYECTSADFTSYTAKVKITAVPKVSTENMSVSLTFGKYHADLTRSSAGVFVGYVDVDIFEDLYFDNAVAVISENGQEKAEIVEMALYPYWQDFLPTVEVSYPNSPFATSQFENGQVTLSYSFKLYVTEREYGIKKISTIVEIDGTTVEERDLTNLLPSSGRDKRIINVDFSGTYKANENSNINVFVKFEDTAGLIHKIDIVLYGDEVITYPFGESIYDKNGKLLYQ